MSRGVNEENKEMGSKRKDEGVIKNSTKFI